MSATLHTQPIGVCYSRSPILYRYNNCQLDNFYNFYFYITTGTTSDMQNIHLSINRQVDMQSGLTFDVSFILSDYLENNIDLTNDNIVYFKAVLNEYGTGNTFEQAIESDVALATLGYRLNNENTLIATTTTTTERRYNYYVINLIEECSCVFAQTLSAKTLYNLEVNKFYSLGNGFCYHVISVGGTGTDYTISYTQTTPYNTCELIPCTTTTTTTVYDPCAGLTNIGGFGYDLNSSTLACSDIQNHILLADTEEFNTATKIYNPSCELAVSGVYSDGTIFRVWDKDISGGTFVTGGLCPVPTTTTTTTITGTTTTTTTSGVTTYYKYEGGTCPIYGSTQFYYSTTYIDATFGNFKYVDVSGVCKELLYTGSQLTVPTGTDITGLTVYNTCEDCQA